MHKLIKEKIEELTERIATTTQLDSAVELACRLLPDASIWVDYEVNADFAVKGIDEVKTVLRQFALEGALLKQFVPSETNPMWYLTYNDKSIRLNPLWSRDVAEGVTCRLVKVGETVSTYPKYKLICDNGDSIEADVQPEKAQADSEEVPF